MISKEEFRKGKISMNAGTLMLNNKYDLMHESEKKDIKQSIIDICKKHKPKRVLEIGFGLGYTATQFQDCNVKKHVIIEAHPEIFKRAAEWAKDYPNVILINDFFQDYKTEEKFDLVYDDRMDMVFENDEFIKSDEKLRRWLKSYCKKGGVVAGYARQLMEIPEFDDGFFFEIDDKKFRQPIMKNGK